VLFIVGNVLGIPGRRRSLATAPYSTTKAFAIPAAQAFHAHQTLLLPSPLRPAPPTASPRRFATLSAASFLFWARCCHRCRFRPASWVLADPSSQWSRPNL
jgi:hypothetical protein